MQRSLLKQKNAVLALHYYVSGDFLAPEATPGATTPETIPECTSETTSKTTVEVTLEVTLEGGTLNVQHYRPCLRDKDHPFPSLLLF
jgi:hypothetical protein